MRVSVNVVKRTTNRYTFQNAKKKKNEEYSTGGRWGGWEKGENSFKRRYYTLFWNTYIRYWVEVERRARRERNGWLIGNYR